MKSLFSSIFCFLLLGSLLAATGCASRQIPVTTEITRTVETVKHDTVVTLRKDSAYYQAYIDCVNGKPVLISSQGQAEAYNARNGATKAKLPISQAGRAMAAPSVQLKDGQLSVNCTQEAQKLFFTWRDKYIQENHKEIVPGKPVEKLLTKFQTLKLWLGGLLFWAACLGAFLFVTRFILRKTLQKSL